MGEQEEPVVPPAVHVITPQGEWGICLNRAAKWIGGIIAALTTSLVVGAVAFAWQSNARLAKLEDVPTQLQLMSNSLQAIVQDTQTRGIKNSEDIAEIKGRIGVLEKGHGK